METRAKTARLLLADDHSGMIAQTARLLADEFDVVGTAGTGPKVIEEVALLDPDVVVLDITLPGMDGIEVARRLCQSGSRTRVVFLTVHEDPDYVRAAMDAGGSAYVSKSRLATDLIPAIHSVLAQNNFISPTLKFDDKP